MRELRRPRQRGQGAQRAGPRRHRLRARQHRPDPARGGVPRGAHWGLYGVVRQCPRAASRGSRSWAWRCSYCCCCRWPSTGCLRCAAAGCRSGSCDAAHHRHAHVAAGLRQRSASATRPSCRWWCWPPWRSTGWPRRRPATVARTRRRRWPGAPPDARLAAAHPDRRGGAGRTRVLSVALYAPALVPGNTLSASDYLWSAAPWAAERPADVPVPGLELRAGRRVDPVEPWLRVHARAAARRAAVEHHIAVGRPHLANAQSAVLSPFSLPGLRAAVLVVARADGRAEGVRAAFGTYLLGRALGHALRRRAAGRAGVRLLPLLPRLGLLAAAERLGAAALAAAAHRPGDPRPRGRCRWRGWPSSWRCSSSAATRSRTSTCWPPRSPSSPSGPWCCAARAALPASAGRCWRSRRPGRRRRAGRRHAAARSSSCWSARATWRCARASRDIALPEQLPAGLRAVRVLGPGHAAWRSATSPRCARCTWARCRWCWRRPRSFVRPTAMRAGVAAFARADAGDRARRPAVPGDGRRRSRS